MSTLSKGVVPGVCSYLPPHLAPIILARLRFYQIHHHRNSSYFDQQGGPLDSVCSLRSPRVGSRWRHRTQSAALWRHSLLFDGGCKCIARVREAKLSSIVHGTAQSSNSNNSNFLILDGVHGRGTVQHTGNVFEQTFGQLAKIDVQSFLVTNACAAYEKNKNVHSFFA